MAFFYIYLSLVGNYCHVNSLKTIFFRRGYVKSIKKKEIINISLMLNLVYNY